MHAAVLSMDIDASIPDYTSRSVRLLYSQLQRPIGCDNKNSSLGNFLYLRNRTTFFFTKFAVLPEENSGNISSEFHYCNISFDSNLNLKMHCSM